MLLLFFYLQEWAGDVVEEDMDDHWSEALTQNPPGPPYINLQKRYLLYSE